MSRYLYLASKGRAWVRLIAITVPVALCGALTALGAGVAQATSLPYGLDPKATGTLNFFDAAGRVVASGTLGDPFVAYVQGSTPGRHGDTKATLFGYLPRKGIPPGAFTGEQLSTSTNYPNAAAPSPLSASALPVVSLIAGDPTLAALVADYPNLATDEFKGLYQLRLKTSGPGQGVGGTYDTADIVISGNSWTQLNPPAAGTPTASPTPASAPQATTAAGTTSGGGAAGGNAGNLTVTVPGTTAVVGATSSGPAAVGGQGQGQGQVTGGNSTSGGDASNGAGGLPGGGAQGKLPRTGANSLPQIALGLILEVAGMQALAAGRRRRLAPQAHRRP